MNEIRIEYKSQVMNISVESKDLSSCDRDGIREIIRTIDNIRTELDALEEKQNREV